jgi:hypothetical protein
MKKTKKKYVKNDNFGKKKNKKKHMGKAKARLSASSILKK